MDEERVRRMLREYQRLEERLLELGAYVPFVADPVAPNYRFPSPRAAEFGLECGTWLDTLMSELLQDSRLDEYPGIRSIRRKRRRSIDLYREVFEERFGFSKGGYALRYVGGAEIRPFAAWATGESPDWYGIYSRYKHDRFALADRYTMRHALNMFVALTMVLLHWKRPPPSIYMDRQSPILEGVLV